MEKALIYTGFLRSASCNWQGKRNTYAPARALLLPEVLAALVAPARAFGLPVVKAWARVVLPGGVGSFRCGGGGRESDDGGDDGENLHGDGYNSECGSFGERGW